MRPINVEFAQNPPLPKWVWNLALFIVSLVVLAEGLYAWHAWRLYRTAQNQEQTILAQLSQRQRAWQMNIQPIQPAPAYLDDAKNILKIENFPLNSVFTAIEALNMPDIKVIGIEVSPAEGTARVELEVSNNDAMLKALDQINQGEPQPRWLLTDGHADVPNNNKGHATLESKW